MNCPASVQMVLMNAESATWLCGETASFDSNSRCPSLRCGGALVRAANCTDTLALAPGLMVKLEICVGRVKFASVIEPSRRPETAQMMLPALVSVTVPVRVVLRVTLPKSSGSGLATTRQNTTFAWSATVTSGSS